MSLSLIGITDSLAVSMLVSVIRIIGPKHYGNLEDAKIISPEELVELRDHIGPAILARLKASQTIMLADLHSLSRNSETLRRQIDWIIYESQFSVLNGKTILERFYLISALAVILAALQAENLEKGAAIINRQLLPGIAKFLITSWFYEEDVSEAAREAFVQDDILPIPIITLQKALDIFL